MLQRIIEFSLRHKTIVLLAVAGLAYLGVASVATSPREFLPDLSSPIIQVLTEKPGLAAPEVENLISRPIENSVRSLPDVINIRSQSSSGLSIVTATFKWGTDYHFARQLISQSLNEVSGKLPAGTDPPFLSNAASRLGEVIQYALTSDTLPLTELREWGEYDVRLRLQGVPGVARVNTAGGEVRQFQVLVDADRLLYHGLGLQDVLEALKSANLNFSGGIIPQGATELSVRGLARLHRIQDLSSVVVASRNGVPVYLKDVAVLREGARIRRGLITIDGKEAVTGTIIKQYGADSQPVIDGTIRELDEMRPFLPPSVKIEPFFNQGELIGVSVGNLKDALLIGGAAVLLVVIFFLASLRTGLIIGATLPLSVLITFVFMKLFHVTVNVMSLGGIAVGLGIMIDAAIVDTENIFRWLRRHPEEPLAATLKGAIEVRRPVAYSTAVIIAVFAPLMFLSGFEGKMFLPFAMTIIVSMLVGFALSLTLTPLLCYLWLRRPAANAARESTAGGPLARRENLLSRGFLRAYDPVLKKALKKPGLAAAAVLAILAVTLFLIPFIGTELLPPFDENAVLLLMTLPAGTSLDETARVTNDVLALCKGAPDVREVISRIGRQEGGEETDETVNFSETFFAFVDRSRRTTSTTDIIAGLRKRIEGYPGIAFNFLTPLSDRIEESLSGSKGMLAVNLFGEDYDILAAKARDVQEIMASVPGVTDLALEQTSGLPLLNVRIDLGAAGRFGLTPQGIAETVEAGLAGKAVTTVLRDVKEFEVFVRLQERFRDDPDKVGNLRIRAPGGVQVRLSDIARISKDTGPMMINRENLRRRVQLTCNVARGSINRVVGEIRSRIPGLNLPAGYSVAFGGNYARQRELGRQITTMVVASLAVVFMLLLAAFNSVWQAALILLTIPLALMGGVWALFLTFGTFNVSSLIGFVAHFGLTVQKGVILVEYINDLREEGMPLDEALIAAGRTRLRPVLMTAFAASLCVLPLALGMGAGSEIQQPMAIVLIGGLMVSTPIVLVILPVLYGRLMKVFKSPKERLR